MKKKHIKREIINDLIHNFGYRPIAAIKRADRIYKHIVKSLNETYANTMEKLEDEKTK